MPCLINSTTPASIAFLTAKVTGSFFAYPVSISNNITPASTYLKTSAPVDVEKIVFSIVVVIITSPL